VLAQRHGHPIATLKPVIDTAGLHTLQRAVEAVYIDELVLRWAVALVRATREVEGSRSALGTRKPDARAHGPRLGAAAGRDHVIPDDIERLFLPVLGHRLLLSASYLAETSVLDRDAALEQVRARCLELAPPPAPDWDR